MRMLRGVELDSSIIHPVVIVFHWPGGVIRSWIAAEHLAKQI